MSDPTADPVHEAFVAAHPDEWALIERARARLPATLVDDFAAGLRTIEREWQERRERLARGEREPIVVSPACFEELVRLGWAERPEPTLPTVPPEAIRVPGNRHDRRARRAKARRKGRA